ncbi:MAG: class I SAM-dependent methyltransferase [Acuticoccus sp.]
MAAPGAGMSALRQLALGARFGLAQAARVGWYTAQHDAGRRLAREVGRTLPKMPEAQIGAPAGLPSRGRLLAHLRTLLARDFANVAAGLYPMPPAALSALPGLLTARRRYLADLPEVVRRRATRSHQEVVREESGRPRYYMQNFHFQTDGWMSEESARLYDTQVETLFFGAAAAMRRQALVPIAERLAKVDQRRQRLLDVASGSGAFLGDLAAAFPRLPVVASDLSPHYLRLARQRISRRRGSGAVVAPAEALPFADGTFDIVTNTYLFHEIPPKVRAAVAAELARVLAPGGLLVVVDSLQTGDTPELDGLLELFPHLFHEPYYKSYLTADLGRIFMRNRLELEGTLPAFFSKVFVLRKS